jgi:hypothetical protein
LLTFEDLTELAEFEATRLSLKLCVDAIGACRELVASASVVVEQNDFWEKIMYKIATTILLLSSPAFAQNNDALRDCPAIGQTGKGELVYSLDCKAIKAENADVNYKPKMPSTTMNESVIPKSGATQTPAETPTTGVNK